MKKIDKTKLVKEMSRDRIGTVPPVKRVPLKRKPGRDKVKDDE